MPKAKTMARAADPVKNRRVLRHEASLLRFDARILIAIVRFMGPSPALV
jgi:hypothetical protein